MKRTAPVKPNAKYPELAEWLRKSLEKHSQKWLADQLGVSESYVSMVEEGDKRFSAHNTSQLVDIFNIDIYRISEMSKLDPEDVKAKYDIGSLNYLPADILMSQFQIELDSARYKRECGEPGSAIEMISFWIKTLEKRIKSGHDTLKDKKEFKRSLNQSYCLRMVSNCDIQPWKYVSLGIHEDYLKVKKLTQEINDNNALAIANTWLADAYYVDSEYKKALDYLSLSLPKLRNNNNEYCEALKDLILIKAHLQDRKGMQVLIDQFTQDRNQGIIVASSDIANILEGIARAKIRFGEEDAFYILEEAEKEIQNPLVNNRFRLLINMQILRSKLDFCERKKSQGYSLDQTQLDHYIKNAIILTNTLKEYQRHRNIIQSLIKKLNDRKNPSDKSYEQLTLFNNK